MAEVTAMRNNALPYPVYAMMWTIVFPIFDNTGALVSGAAGLDSEVSQNGDTFADCTNEATEIGSSGEYALTLTDAEMEADIVAIIVKTSTTDAKAAPIILYPRKLVRVYNGTITAGGSAFATLDSNAPALVNALRAYLIQISISGVRQARIVSDYSVNRRADVVPDFSTGPSNGDAYNIYLPEGVQMPQADVVAFGSAAGTFASGIPAVSLVAASIQAIWDALTSALTTSGSIGKFLLDRLDAAITSRMATYTQPTGFLAAAFPSGTIASTTNITAGTVTNATNVTNLTNAPTAGDFTATMKTSLNAATPASIVGAVGSVTGNVGGNVLGGVAGNLGGNVLGNVAGSVASVVAPVAIDAASVDAIWDEAVDGAVTARQSLRLANSANGAKLSGAATTTVTIRDLADTKARVTATVDADGNRTAVARDLT